MFCYSCLVSCLFASLEKQQLFLCTLHLILSTAWARRALFGKECWVRVGQCLSTFSLVAGSRIWSSCGAELLQKYIYIVLLFSCHFYVLSTVTDGMVLYVRALGCVGACVWGWHSPFTGISALGAISAAYPASWEMSFGSVSRIKDHVFDESLWREPFLCTFMTLNLHDYFVWSILYTCCGLQPLGEIKITVMLLCKLCSTTVV